MRYRLFRRKSNGNYYFQFLTDDEQIILSSPGYPNQEMRNDGLEFLINNADQAERYQLVNNNDDSNFAFVLLSENGQEIGRSPNYATAADRDVAVSVFQIKVPTVRINQEAKTTSQSAATTTATESEKPYETDGNKDNYKPLGFYEVNGTETEDGFDTFSAEGLHYFSYHLGGNVYLISEGYQSTGARDNGINSVANNLNNEARYQREVHPNGKHYFNLRAGNNQEIATSRWFDSEGEMNSVIARLIVGVGLAGKSAEEGTQLEAANRTAAISIAVPPPPLEDKPKKKRKKRKTEKKPKAEKVYLANGTYLFNEITYQIFRSGNDKHYFTFKNKEGKTLFLNADVRGFATQEEAQLVVDEIMKYGPYEVNYDGKMARNGKYYFYLKGEDNKNLAKSFFYNSEEDMQESVGLLLGSELAIAAAAAARVKDDYLECKSYYGEAGFHRFQQEDEYYFSYNDGNGETVLRSQGYTTEAARENGISSVITNASLDERWKTDTVLDGRYHFFSLKAGNHQEIAQSCYYENEPEMQSALEWVRGQDSTIGKGAQQVNGVWWSASMLRAQQEEDAAAVLAAATPEKIVDDYLTCKSYYGNPEFNKFKGEDGEYYFSYNDQDGETILRSEGYTTEAARENGINSVIKNAQIEKRWVTYTALNGKYHFFALKAGNHQEIARSCYYEDKATMLAILGWIKGEDSSIGIGSQMGSSGLMSAAALSAEAAAIAAAEAKRKAEEEAAAAEAKRQVEAEARRKKEAAAAAAVAAAVALAAKKKAEEEEAAAVEAKRQVEAEAEARRKKEAAAAAAVAAAAALAAKKKAEEEAAAVEAKRQAEAEARRKKEAAAAAAVAAVAALAAKKKAEEEAAAVEAKRQVEAEARRKKEAAAAAAVAAAAALAAKKKAEEEAAAVEAKRQAEAEARRKKEAAAAAAAVAAAALAAREAEAAALAARQKADRDRIAAASAAANVPDEREGDQPFLSGIWPWLLALLALLLLLWLMRGCFGCGEEKIIPPPVVPIDTIETKVEPVDTILEIEPAEPLGPNAVEMGFAAGTIEAALANCMSNPACDLGQTFTWDGTQYPFNSAKMNRAALPNVDNIAKLMKAYPNVKIDIFGFIDGKESDIYNGPYGDGVITLSGIRARCLYKKLAKRGIAKSRMTFEGFGAKRPIASNDTKAGRRKNRRTEIKIAAR